MLYQLSDLTEGLVIKRPSKFIKTPYVADVLINENSEIERKEVIAHSASLGCCGLADANARVLMSAMPPSKTKSPAKCSHRIYLSVHKEGNNEEIIGIYPKLAETLAEAALNQNLLSSLKNLKSWRRETTIKVTDLGVDSRFDFSGIDANGMPFIMEIKNVPLADYEDVSAKERKKNEL